MKLRLIMAVAMIAMAMNSTLGQGFNAGSNGSSGPLDVGTDTTLPLPPDGILHCTIITIRSNATLRFARNALNTPAYLLAQGEVLIDGTINITGGSPGGPLQGGLGGPGGFDGGPGGITTGSEVLPGGNGLGPGGGKHTKDAQEGGDAGYATRANWETAGATYGTPALIPIVGGSGGGGIDGNQDGGGGGGGGAILIASNTRIRVTASGKILAFGGKAGIAGKLSYNSGSGGAIRLVAPQVYGKGELNAGDLYGRDGRGAGRIRIDSIYKVDPANPLDGALLFAFAPPSSKAVGSTMLVFPPNAARLDIINAASTAIPEGTLNPVVVQLPFNANTNQTVTVQARNFNARIPVRVVLTPKSGDSLSYDTEIDNTIGPVATATINAGFPLNQLVHVNAWTR